MYLLALGTRAIYGCSNLLVSKGNNKQQAKVNMQGDHCRILHLGATTDGTTIISYSADSADLMGDIYNYPAAAHLPGDLREIYSWDTGT